MRKPMPSRHSLSVNGRANPHKISRLTVTQQTQRLKIAAFTRKSP